MGLSKDPSQQDFFKKRWRQRVWRLKKQFLPVLLSGLFVFGLMITMTHLLTLEIFKEEGGIMVFAHTLLAVILAVTVVLLGDSLHLRRMSRFSPIRITIRRRGHHE